MTYEQIMAWGERNHYPFLRIGDEAEPPSPDTLRHGQTYYEELRISPVRLELTSLRICHWNEVIGDQGEAQEEEKAPSQEAG
jgi:hypothetical protein